MTEDEEALIEIKAMIAKQPPEMQRKIRECAEKIHALLREYGACGGAAFGLVGAELAAQESESAS
jgi:hypothetical protein